MFTGNNKKGPGSGSITIPTDIKASTRLRITMRTGSSPASCDDNFNGEVQDYTVNFAGGTKSGFTLESISGNSLSERSFLVYPNPVADILFVKLDGWEGRKVIRLLDMTGRTILFQTVSDTSFEIDVSSFPKGIYLLDANNGIYRENKKISIQ